MKTIEDIVRSAIQEAASAEDSQWTGSIYEGIKLVEIDKRGDVGELVVVRMLEALGRTVFYSHGTTSDEKHWDFMCDDLSYEVKAATLGKDKITFQHENIHKTRQYDGLIFVDIAPADIYITCYDKKSIDWGSLHRRKDSTAYKWDTYLKETRKHPVIKNRIETLSDFQKSFNAMEKRIRTGKSGLNRRDL